MIFFIHIHKTGGQTLGKRLASAFSPDESHLISDDLFFPRDLHIFRKIIATKQFAESHVFGPMFEGVSECEFVVAVRSPVDQLISLYRHMRREKNHFGHRPSNVLPPDVFVDTMEFHLIDYQTTGILSCFLDLNFEINRSGRARALIENLYRILDKIRWLVPTKSIDEFTDLWSLETGKSTFTPKGSINVAPADDFDQRPFRELLLSRPRLYAIDSALHQIAVTRFKDYRRRVLDSKIPWPQVSNSRLAYNVENSCVWLSRNWYDPERANGKVGWSFGPNTGGEVRFRRSEAEKYLNFDVVTVNGISYEDIRCVRKRDFSPIDVDRLRRSESLTTYSVPLDSLRVLKTVSF